MIHGMNHFTVLSDDLEKTLGFYVDLLGLKPARAQTWAFPAPGCTWTARAVLHIIAGRPLPEQRAGVLDHMAFTATGLADVKAKLDGKKIPTSCDGSVAPVPGSCFATTPAAPRSNSTSILRSQPIDLGNRVSLVCGCPRLGR